jgi:hypothetical protein
MQECVSQISTFFRMVRNFCLPLLVIAAATALLHDIVVAISVRIGFVSELAGLVALAPAVLIDLVGMMLMLHIIHPGMPAFTRIRKNSIAGSAVLTEGFSGLSALSVMLIPFFAYYAAWGLLGDIIRDYSLLALKLDPIAEHGRVLDLRGGWWIAASIALV